MNSVSLSNFKTSLNSYVVAAKLEEGFAAKKTRDFAKQVFFAVQEIAARKEGFDLKEVKKIATEVKGNEGLSSTAKSYILGTIASALNPSIKSGASGDFNGLSNEAMIEAISTEIQKLEPPARVPVAKKMQGDRLAFLGEKKEVAKAFNPKELEGKVDVKARKKELEALFAKQKENLENKRKDFFANVKNQIKSDVLYKNAVSTLSEALKIKFEKAFDEVHEQIVEQVKADLGTHFLKIEALGADLEMTQLIQADIHAITDIPKDISMEEFFALAYIFHSYEKCLHLDKEKWKLSPEERQKSSAINSTLNYYKYFYDNLKKFQSIKGWEFIHKHIRELENEDTYSAITNGKAKNVDEVEFMLLCSDYLENGGFADDNYTPLPFAALECSRLPPPSQVPQWIINTMKKPLPPLR